MMESKHEVEYDARKTGITIDIKMKNMFWFKVGLVFIKIGAKIAGLGINLDGIKKEK